jgi:hypothetical protein
VRSLKIAAAVACLLPGLAHAYDGGPPCSNVKSPSGGDMCEYADPAYKAANARFMSCLDPIVKWYTESMTMVATFHPYFGVAWNAFTEELKRPGADATAARQRFEDRILRTAEPDAMQLYEIFNFKNKQAMQRCGAMPIPPFITAESVTGVWRALEADAEAKLKVGLADPTTKPDVYWLARDKAAIACKAANDNAKWCEPINPFGDLSEAIK